MSGRVGDLSPEQQKALDDFRSQITEKSLINREIHDDHYLLRFLRARKFDVGRTLEMWEKCEKWRVDNKVDEIYATFKFDEEAEVQKLYPRFYHKTDLQGRPLYIEVLSDVDLDKLFKITTRERMQKFFIFEYERLIRLRLPACSEAAGKHIGTSFTILDLKNCGVMQALKIKDLLQLVIEIGQNYYPETMGGTFIINAPWLFDTVWNLLKMWMDEVTTKKIQIFKSGKAYTNDLFQLVDPANVPATLGGLCSCPGGCHTSNVGPWKK
eukprot:Partr_v1_DN23937_c0_g1_i1_m48867 putative SEC14 cytosolic factor